MRYIFSVLLTFSVLAGCSSEQPIEATSEAPETMQTIEPSAIDEPSDDSGLYVEYVWHKEGENFSREALMEKVILWNQMIDAGEYEINRANLLFPRQETEDYDFVWVMLWPSVEARNAGWAYWAANDEAEWAEATAGVLSYREEDAFLFRLSRERTATVPNTTSVYENQFSFCFYNEGKGDADFAAFQMAHTDFVGAYETEKGPGSYAYVLLTPTFETEQTPDFVWLDLWASAEEKADGLAYFEGSELQTQLDDMATCNLLGFEGLNIRS